MRFDLILHEEDEAAETLPIERPVPTEAHVEGRFRVGNHVYYIFDLFFYGCAVSAMDVSRGRDMTQTCWD